ncbi:MAG: hypothetical protein HUU20_16375 [Pirellulales bacterium]|nr:hypothetical protein [Pirellulales bacterium]
MSRLHRKLDGAGAWVSDPGPMFPTAGLRPHWGDLRSVGRARSGDRAQARELGRQTVPKREAGRACKMAGFQAEPGNQLGHSSATRVERFDESGNLVWTRDERGFITDIQYDPVIGSMTRRIDDVDGSKLALHSGWSTPAGGGLHLVSDYEHDALGRTTQVLGPAHDVDDTSVRTATWTVYSDDGREVRTAQGCMTETSGLDLDTLSVDEWGAMTVDQWDAMSVG